MRRGIRVVEEERFIFEAGNIHTGGGGFGHIPKYRHIRYWRLPDQRGVFRFRAEVGCCRDGMLLLWSESFVIGFHFAYIIQ